jgi:hypothetical protein
MKIRTGFVSNSSSSSFVAAVSALTKDELAMLLAYQDSPENTDGWMIRLDEEAQLVRGWATMDNDALSEWCEKNGFNKVRFESYGC